ncbi:MAG: NifB/NifX family molybdenum-iron cluster-binding protein [Candidatus Brocadiia bacterium]
MKIFLTSTGESLSAEIDPRFGRAKYFISYDDQSGEHEVVDNKQNLNAPSGAGIQAATNVSEAGADWVVSGHIGPKAMRVLKEADIRVAIGASGTVEEAIEDFTNGELEEADSADVEGHW